MNLQHLPPDNWTKLYNTLKNGKFTFQLVETKKKIYLVWNKTKFYNDPNPPRLNIEDLGRISAAKKEIIKNIDRVNLQDNIGNDFFIGVRQPKQFYYEYTEQAIFGGDGPEYYQRVKNTIVKDAKAIQIDINAAYITAVKNFGLLSADSYNKFFIEETEEKRLIKKSNSSRHKGHNGEIYKYSKDSRLIAVGSLAQDKKISTYIKGKKVKEERQYNEKEANVFWSAAAEVGRIMIEILENCQGYFFWVDAIFIPKQQAEKAKEILKSYGYNHHSKEIILSQDGGNFESIETDTGEIKRYFVPPSRTTDFLKTINNNNFVNEILKSYKILQEKYKTDLQQETLRKATVRHLKRNINLDSKLNLKYLAEKCIKLGLTIEDLIKIETMIIEKTKDAIFQNEILQESIIIRLENLNNLKPLPAPESNLPDGKTIEREFLREFY
jgi:hypothetical protein